MSGPYFIDAHCHLSDERVFGNASTLITRAQVRNIQKIMLGGVKPEEWDRQDDLKSQFPSLLKTSFGIHPWTIEKHSRAELDTFLEKLEVKARGADAIGETGLDFHPKRDATRFKDQEYFFRTQIEIAKNLSKPLVLHIVSAHEKAISIIQEMNSNSVPILVHSFSGSKEIAKEWVKLGALLSFSGVILIEGKYEKVKHALSTVPLQNLLFETDAPDQGWIPGRGNEPAHVLEVYSGAAKLLNVLIAELQQKVAENFLKLG